MLIEGGYAHSLKALLNKSRAEEMARAARRAHGAPSEDGYIVRVIDWVVRLWTRWQPPRDAGTRADAASIHR